MAPPNNRNDRLPRRLVPFLWLFLATIQIKVDGEEAFYPFFRIVVFLALPFAMLYLANSVMRASFTARAWLGLSIFAYLMFYPFATMFFNVSEDESRHMKDALYTMSIYMILFYLVRRYFMVNGRFDMDGLGRLLVKLAVLESVIALLLWAGFNINLGFGMDFKQMEWLGTRLHGVVGTPTHLAPIVAIACMFLMTQRSSHLNTLTFGFLFVVLVMTGSRGALAGFVGAAIMFAICRPPNQRIKLKTIYQMVILGILILPLFVLFAERSQEIVQVAVRTDPEGWEKSRSFIWAMRLGQYLNLEPMAQLFGAGHRSFETSFNINVEYLLAYGIIYTAMFNFVYMFVTLRFARDARRYGRKEDSILLMMAVFCYLFAQGINYMFPQFMHFFQFCMIMLLIGFFRKSSPKASIQPVVQLTPASQPLPGASR